MIVLLRKNKRKTDGFSVGVCNSHKKPSEFLCNILTDFGLQKMRAVVY